MWSGRPQRHKWATCWEPQLGRSAKIDWQRHFKTKDSASGLLHSRCILRGLRVCVCVYQPDDFSGGIGSAEFPLMGSTGPHTHTHSPTWPASPGGRSFFSVYVHFLFVYISWKNQKKHSPLPSEKCRRSLVLCISWEGDETNWHLHLRREKE